MQVRNILLLTSKVLGKAIVGLLAVLLIVLLIIHIPAVQRGLTPSVADYLSSRIKSKVEIETIRFSVFGNVSIKGLKIRDPESADIFSSGDVEVSTSIFKLIRGKLIFDEIRISGVSGKLIQNEKGLNIQFIIDAFQGPPSQTTSTGTASTSLEFKNVILENIIFEFTSANNGTSVSTKVGKFNGEDIEVSINPNKISAGNVQLENSATRVSYRVSTDSSTTTITTEAGTLFDTDFGSGFDFDVRSIQLTKNDLFIHRDSVITTPRFDPNHLELQNINLSISNIIVDSISLAAALHSLSAQSPGFILSDARAEIQMSPDAISLSGLHLSSNSNEINGDFQGGYDVISGQKDALISVDVLGHLDPQTLSYFLNDSIMSYFNGWEFFELKLKSDYSRGKGEVKVLSLKTGSSLIEGSGTVSNILERDRISWKDVAMNVAMGKEFRNTLDPFVHSVTLPPDATIKLASSGDMKNIFIDGNIITTWGEVKTKGYITQVLENAGIDVTVEGQRVDVGKWMTLPWIGPVDLSVSAKGQLANKTDVAVNGSVSSLEIVEESIHDIRFEGRASRDSVTAVVSIADPNYRAEVKSEISFTQSLLVVSELWFRNFDAGALLKRDSALRITGSLNSKIKIDGDLIEGELLSDSILFENNSSSYFLDTMALNALISPTASHITYLTDHGNAEMESNFDIRNSQDLIKSWSTDILSYDTKRRSIGNRTAKLDLELKGASLFRLLGFDVDNFSTLNIKGQVNEQTRTGQLVASTGNFTGYGLTLDTLSTTITVLQRNVNADLKIDSLYYSSFKLGNLDFNMATKGDSSASRLLVAHDSTTMLGLNVVVLRSDSGFLAYTKKLTAFNMDYIIDPENPIHIRDGDVSADNFSIAREDMKINIDGNTTAFNVNLENVDLTPLNDILFPDTTVINKGVLTGRVSYSKGEKLDLNARIDSLRLYNSNVLTISAIATTDDKIVPFEFLLTNTSNKIELKGDYFLDNENVDATMTMDVNNLELFSFLVSDFIEEMNGSIKGKATIDGKLTKPDIKGQLRFVDVDLITVNPRLDFKVKDDVVTIDSASLFFKKFTIYDEKDNPFEINGKLSSNDYESFAYNLRLKTDKYYLINNPDSSHGALRGSLVIATDVKLSGNEKDTNVDANVTIKDDTNLTLVSSRDDTELLNSEGIINFVDPSLWLDTTLLNAGANFYDSLIASLPDFNLNSTIKIEPNAVLTLIVDEISGDYAQASGDATLDLGYDRTGNLRLSGTYTIRKGLYRVSFYDLVKKNFSIVPGSSINWSGDPENGELDIKAQYTVATNSIGLIGHEIGENEKSIYKRSLDYEVGIVIKGTVEKPIVSFALDLPEKEKANYPVLANKLDRLRQPEYASELNKQVFGLLVLGGFLPETGSDINQSVIATTALSNSVNALLATQLNRFASQYVKGVNIDVGIQSYSDYSTPGGKTRTAMDFRVSKSIMNDRLSFEVGGDFDINQDQSGSNSGKNYRGDIAIIYDLTGGGDKQLKLFNNETYDIVYQEIRNTGISLIFIREFSRNKEPKAKDK
jgi:translocation and assembly module TamB